MANVILEIDDEVAVVTFSRPPLNLFTWEMLDELADVLGEVAAAPARALLLKASGPHFSAGADVPTMFEGLSAQAAEAHLGRNIAALGRLQDLPIPTIAVAQGMCLTAGLEIALRCDLLWAGETAQFAQFEALIGTTTLLGGAQLLSQRAGPARAAEICYSANLYGAADFERWGIVSRVLPDAELDAAATSFARQLAKGPTQGLKATKRLIRAAEEGVAAADRLIGPLGARLLETNDMKAGVQAVAKHGARNFRGTFPFHGN
jgi:enoyl-CoA hydratase